MNATDHGADLDAACGMRLRIEEDLGVNHALLMRAAQVRGGERVEIALIAQHTGHGVVEIEEGLQIRELIGAAQLRRRGVGKTDAMCTRELEGHLRLQRAFDMNMELGLWQSADELFHAHHRLESRLGYPLALFGLSFKAIGEWMRTRLRY